LDYDKKDVRRWGTHAQFLHHTNSTVGSKQAVDHWRAMKAYAETHLEAAKIHAAVSGLSDNTHKTKALFDHLASVSITPGSKVDAIMSTYHQAAKEHLGESSALHGNHRLVEGKYWVVDGPNENPHYNSPRHREFVMEARRLRGVTAEGMIEARRLKPLTAVNEMSFGDISMVLQRHGYEPSPLQRGAYTKTLGHTKHIIQAVDNDRWLHTISTPVKLMGGGHGRGAFELHQACLKQRII